MGDTLHQDPIARRIILVRGRRVMLDRDLAELYGVPAKALNQAVRRNVARFPDDFMFRLTRDEATSLRSQFVTLEKGRGRHSKYLPFAFTEQGVAMLSSVLRSEKAIEVNIKIMRAFVRLRGLLTASEEFARVLRSIENRLDSHDRQIQTALSALKGLFGPSAPNEERLYSPDEKRRRMGFCVRERRPAYGSTEGRRGRCTLRGRRGDFHDHSL